MAKYDDPNALHELYTVQQKSTGQIAEICGTTSQTIRRKLIKHKIPLRTASESQKLCLANGRRKHPTKGKTVSLARRRAISDSMVKTWSEMPSEKREDIRQKHADKYARLSDASKKKLQDAAHKAIRRSSKEGSRIEHATMNLLRRAGFEVIFHAKHTILNENLEIDIYLPSIRTAIELDGPSHFYPIWGEDALLRTKTSDQDKTGLLLTSKANVIRVKVLARNCTPKYCSQMAEKILAQVREFYRNKPRGQYVEIESMPGYSSYGEGDTSSQLPRS